MFIRIQTRPLQDITDAQLVESFRAGDNKAFERIFTLMKIPLIFSAVAIVHSVADAEDIVGNAFLKLYTHGRKRLTSLEHIRRWMEVVVRNESIDLLRRKTKEKKAHLFLSYQAESPEEDDRDIDIDILLEQAVSCLQALSRQRHVVLRLSFFENKTTREIAELLQIDGQTVLNHKAKGIHVLRCQMAARNEAF